MRNKLLRNIAGLLIGLFFAFSSYTLEWAIGIYFMLFIVPGAFASMVFAVRIFIIILDTMTYNEMVSPKNLIAEWEITPALWQASRKILFIQDKKGRIAVFCIMAALFAAIGISSLFSDYLQGKIIGVSISALLIVVFWIMMFTHKRYHLYNSKVIFSRFGVVMDDKVCDWMDSRVTDYEIKKISGDFEYIHAKYSKQSGNKIISENLVIPIPPEQKNNADMIVEQLITGINQTTRKI